jgi:hypothetical protein
VGTLVLLVAAYKFLLDNRLLFTSSALSTFNVSCAKVSQQLLKAEEAVRLALTVTLEHTLLELLPAVGAHKAFWVELLCHGSDHTTNNHLPADAALVLAPICLVKT